MHVEKLKLDKANERSPDKKQIYIVDDDESICRSLRLLLETYGFAVDTFSSSEEFFSVVPDSAPGCLIMDINMPGLNGWDAQQKLLKSGCKRPVIIITADKNGGLREKALNQGAVGFLHKPIENQELVNMVNLAFNRPVNKNDYD